MFPSHEPGHGNMSMHTPVVEHEPSPLSAQHVVFPGPHRHEPPTQRTVSMHDSEPQLAYGGIPPSLSPRLMHLPSQQYPVESRVSQGAPSGPHASLQRPSAQKGISQSARVMHGRAARQVPAAQIPEAHWQSRRQDPLSGITPAMTQAFSTQQSEAQVSGLRQNPERSRRQVPLRLLHLSPCSHEQSSEQEPSRPTELLTVHTPFDAHPDAHSAWPVALVPSTPRHVPPVHSSPVMQSLSILHG